MSSLVFHISCSGSNIEMSFHLYVAEDGATARHEARGPMEG